MILGEKSERRDQSPFSFSENINLWKSLPRAPEFEYLPLVSDPKLLQLPKPRGFFLDVNVERTATGFETSVYRKPTFTGQYLRWESFSPTKQKINLISTFLHRALMICTKSKLNEEIKHIKNILLDNGYPESIIDCNISKKIAQFSMPKRVGPEKCPVYLRVPWIGKASIGLDKNVKTAVESCYGSVTTRVVFTSKRMLPVARKDVLPTTLKSSVVYEYSCPL